jgi:hypothetical protein
MCLCTCSTRRNHSHSRMFYRCPTPCAAVHPVLPSLQHKGSCCERVPRQLGRDFSEAETFLCLGALKSKLHAWRCIAMHRTSWTDRAPAGIQENTFELRSREISGSVHTMRAVQEALRSKRAHHRHEADIWLQLIVPQRLCLLILSMYFHLVPLSRFPL